MPKASSQPLQVDSTTGMQAHLSQQDHKLLIVMQLDAAITAVHVHKFARLVHFDVLQSVHSGTAPVCEPRLLPCLQIFQQALAHSLAGQHGSHVAQWVPLVA